MNTDSEITEANTGTLAVLFEAGPDLMTAWLCCYLPYHTRTRMLMLNRNTRAWILKNCRALCNELDCGKTLQQRLYNFPHTIRVTRFKSSTPTNVPPLLRPDYFVARDFPDVFEKTRTRHGPVEAKYRIDSAPMMESFHVIETVLYPTSEYPLIDDVGASIGLHASVVPPIFFKFDLRNVDTRTRGTIRRDLTHHDKRPLVTREWTSWSDNPDADGLSQIFEKLLFTESELREPLMVFLSTPLSHVLAAQDRSWITYLSKMRRMRNDEDLDSQLKRDPFLAIQGAFAYTGVMTITNIKTNRIQRVVVLDYVTRAVQQSLHRVAGI